MLQIYLILFIVFFLFNFCASAGLKPCLDSTGLTYLPSATSCDNELDDAICIEIFASADHTPGAVVVDTDCINPDMTKISLECANRCGMCCERAESSCGDSETSPIDCSLNIQRCSDPAWSIVMNTYCPGTCGTCKNATCRDLNNRCIDMTGICNHIVFQNFMTLRCAKTCNRCTTISTTTTLANTVTMAPPSTSLCSDNAGNCAANARLCNIPSYYNFMTQKCPQTCNRCPGTINTSCVDNNPNCAAWIRNGFCRNNFYTVTQKRQYCGRSCNLC
uniref:ShKT domain-containing protein n=1 Tax=Panagrolaimus davidi TaxID=227884 RepID=A0A914Q180_9BILA